MPVARSTHTCWGDRERLIPCRLRTGRHETRWQYTMEPCPNGTTLTESFESLWCPIPNRAVELLLPRGQRLKRRRVVVGRQPCGALSCLGGDTDLVDAPLGVDPGGTVIGPRSSTGRHHQSSVTTRRWRRRRQRQRARRNRKHRKGHAATGFGDIGMPGRRGRGWYAPRAGRVSQLSVSRGSSSSCRGQRRTRVRALRVRLEVLLRQRRQRRSAPGRREPPTTLSLSRATLSSTARATRGRLRFERTTARRAVWCTTPKPAHDPSGGKGVCIVVEVRHVEQIPSGWKTDIELERPRTFDPRGSKQLFGVIEICPHHRAHFR